MELILDLTTQQNQTVDTNIWGASERDESGEEDQVQIWSLRSQRDSTCQH